MLQTDVSYYIKKIILNKMMLVCDYIIGLLHFKKGKCIMSSAVIMLLAITMYILSGQKCNNQPIT